MANFARQPSSAEGSITRRSFLKGARYLGFTAATLPWLMRDWTTSAIAAVNIQDLSPDASVDPAPAAPPSTSSGGSALDPMFLSPERYGLRLENNLYVQVYGFSGGEPVAQYLTGAVAPDGSLPKRISGYRYQDIVFYYLPAPNTAINAWLIDSLRGKAPAASGSIVVQLSMNSSGSSRWFKKAIVFPQADSTTGSPAPMRVTLAAQQTGRSSGNFQVTPMTHIEPFGSLHQGIFSIAIDNLQLNEVCRIEPMRFTTTLIPAVQGSGYQGTVPRELSTLRIQLPETRADNLYSWHGSFVEQGLNAEAQERSGTITWRSSNSSGKPLLTVTLYGLGILSVVRLPTKPGYVQAEMYCQKLVPEFF